LPNKIKSYIHSKCLFPRILLLIGFTSALFAGGSVVAAEMESGTPIVLDCDANLGNLETYPDYNPCPDGLNLTIDERFDEMNGEIWERSTGGFPENDCRFVDDPARVRFDGDGKMRLVMVEKTVPSSFSRHEKKIVDEKQCASGEMRTILEHGPYGRLEARMKSPDTSGFIQSLFTFQFYKDPWQEIDIELQGRLPEEVSTNVITTHAEKFEDCDVYECTSNMEKHLSISGRHSASWHVYAIDWRPGKIQFFVDGRLKREISKEEIDKAGGNYPDEPAVLIMNFWQPTHEIAQWFGGEWSLDQLPLIAEYDWFRFYQLEQSEAQLDD